MLPYLGYFQGNAVINFCDVNVPYTRISEHKHFSPWEEHAESVYFKEYSSKWKLGDIPYYPIRLVKEKQMLKKYVDRSAFLKKVSFVGRLGTYRYIDMDKSIEDAIEIALFFIKLNKRAVQIPIFFQNPL